MKLEDIIATVTESLRENGAEKTLIDKTIKDLQKAAADDKAGRAPGKKSKFQYVIVATEEAPDLGYVVQLEEGAAPQTVVDRVVAAANSFNNSRKGRRVPVNTIGETLQNVPGKWYKYERPAGEVTRVKTKDAVAIIKVKNKLPR